MRRTWRNVCAVVAAEDAARNQDRPGRGPAAPKRHFPRDIPADARPREAAASHKPQGVPSKEHAGAGPTDASGAGGFRLTLDPDGTLGGRPVTHGPLLPEPDYTGMTRSERIIARNEWRIKRRIIG
jgi:hypothetical protein